MIPRMIQTTSHPISISIHTQYSRDSAHKPLAMMGRRPVLVGVTLSAVVVHSLLTEHRKMSFYEKRDVGTETESSCLRYPRSDDDQQ